MLEPLCKRRVRAEVGAPVAPVLEFALPAELSPEQRGCYRTVLTRFYEVLADPRPPRNAGHRSAHVLGASAGLPVRVVRLFQ